MGASSVVPAAADEDPSGVPPPLIDPLQVADSFATHLGLECLGGYGRVTASVARVNPFGELERSIVARTVLTTDDLIREVEAAVATLLNTKDPAVQAKTQAMMERLIKQMTSGHTSN